MLIMSANNLGNKVTTSGSRDTGQIFAGSIVNMRNTFVGIFFFFFRIAVFPLNKNN